MTATANALGRGWAAAPDGALLEQVRSGHWDAYAELWRRHLPSAYAVASQYRGRGSVEDIVGEASLRVYDRIRAGKGPTTNFRSYFLTTVKSVAVDFCRAELRLVPTESEQLEVAADVVPALDPAVRVDQDLVRVAFHRLSGREQEVLWRVVVEGCAPSAVSASLGLSANGVSAAASRARQSLRDSYLDAHSDRAVERANSPECRWVLAHMGKYVRGKMRAGQRTRVERHLRDCRHARVLVTELNDINRGLPALLVPLAFVGGVTSPTLWAAAGMAASLASTTGHQPPAADMSGLATVATAGSTTATGAMVAKTAAVVAAGAFGAGLGAPTPGPGIWSNDRVQVHSAGPGLRSLRVNDSDPRRAPGSDQTQARVEDAATGWRFLEPFASMPGSVDASFLLRTDEMGAALVTEKPVDDITGSPASLETELGADAPTATPGPTSPAPTSDPVTPTPAPTTPTPPPSTNPVTPTPAPTSDPVTPTPAPTSDPTTPTPAPTSDPTTPTPAPTSDPTTPTPAPTSDPTTPTPTPTSDPTTPTPTPTTGGGSSSETTAAPVATTPTPSGGQSGATTTVGTTTVATTAPTADGPSSTSGTATTSGTAASAGTAARATASAGPSKDASATVTAAEPSAAVNAATAGTATTAEPT